MRLLFSLIFVSAWFLARCQSPVQKVRTLIVVFDGLRPDYITPDVMPHVYSLKENGSYARNHHSIFPTVTRVNASSYATGSYPAKHGLLGNSVYFPEGDTSGVLNTGDARELMRLSRATNNNLLTAVSLGEILKASGSKMMVFSSGSSGQAFLQNHTISGGAVINPELVLPETLEQDLYNNIGPPPAPSYPNIQLHDWAARAFLHYAIAPNGPLVSAIWFSDPDGTAHRYGIGSPEAMKSIKAVDDQFGNILKVLDDKGLKDDFNIIITADHGFVTQKGTISLSEFLVTQGLKKDQASDDVILAGNAIYVRNHDADLIPRIVAALQSQPWVGAIFTKSKAPSDPKGWVEGTLSFNVIHWDHHRAADILVDYNWNNEKNSYGYAGSSFATGVAGHGGSSPYEINIPLIAAGPAFKKGYESPFPTSNTDIVPTILHYYKIAIPRSMDGRVLDELMTNQPLVKTVVVGEKVVETSVNHRWGIYRLRLHQSVVGKQRYIDFTEVERIPLSKK